jgi:hypothetical protein
MGAPTTPRHIGAQLALARSYAEATLGWLDQVISQIERGDLP